MFIEVQRITTTGRGTPNEKELCQLELINIGTIRACRHWHVGKGKGNPGYDQTILIMGAPFKNEEINEHNFSLDKDFSSNKEKVSTILIKEKYEHFRDRLSCKVPVNKVSETN